MTHPWYRVGTRWRRETYQQKVWNWGNVEKLTKKICTALLTKLNLMNLKLNILLDYYFFKIFLCDGVPGSVLKLLFVFNDMKSLLQVAVYDDKSWWWFTSLNNYILYDIVLSDIFYFSNQICNMTTSFRNLCILFSGLKYSETFSLWKTRFFTWKTNSKIYIPE